jgi:hypothetical protein
MPYIWPMPTTKYVLLFSLALGLLGSCHAPYHKPLDPTEAGKDFIDATLKAEYHIADDYILRDPLNERLFKRYKHSYNDLPDSTKDSYARASIVIYNVNKVNDSTTIITFANTFRNERRNIRLIKDKGEWWVDFAYTFTDSLINQP